MAAKPAPGSAPPARRSRLHSEADHRSAISNRLAVEARSTKSPRRPVQGTKMAKDVRDIHTVVARAGAPRSRHEGRSRERRWRRTFRRLRRPERSDVATNERQRANAANDASDPGFSDQALCFDFVGTSAISARVAARTNAPRSRHEGRSRERRWRRTFRRLRRPERPDTTERTTTTERATIERDDRTRDDRTRDDRTATSVRRRVA